MEVLSKRLENLIRSLRSRHGRRDSNDCLCDGLRACSEILSLRPDLVKAVVLRAGMSFSNLHFPVEPVVLPEAEFDRVACTVNSQGILTVAERPAYVPLNAPVPDPFVLLLDRVGDPGNFGTILRTARAVGLKEVWLTGGSVDPFSDKVLRSASGAQFALSLRRVPTAPEAARLLTELGIDRIYRTLPAEGGNVFLTEKLFDRTAIVLGCEATGVSEISGALPLNIPMPGTAESLNVAQAGTVILFEYVRRMFC